MALRQFRGSNQIMRKTISNDRMADDRAKQPLVLIELLSNQGLANGATIDGQAVTTGDRVGCFAQTTALENGIYIVDTSGSWARDPNFESGDSVAGSYFTVQRGDDNENTIFMVANNKGSDVVGTDVITVTKPAGAIPTITYQNGIEESGGVVEQGGTLVKNTNITAGAFSYDMTKVVAGGLAGEVRSELTSRYAQLRVGNIGTPGGMVGVDGNTGEAFLKAYNETSGDMAWLHGTATELYFGAETAGGANIGTWTGVQYEEDYSANFVNRSLVDMEYVNTTINNIPANNGITNDSGVIQLGGPLVEDTAISGNGFRFDLDITDGTNTSSLTMPPTGAMIKITGNATSLDTGVEVDATVTSLYMQNAGGVMGRIRLLDNTNIEIGSTQANWQGAIYEADYSANFVNESLVTRRFVENLVANGKSTVVRAMATGDLTLSGTQTVDGVALVDGDLCYAGEQTTSSEDGAYIVRAGAWEQSAGWVTGEEVAGTTITVTEGTVNADTKWIVTNDKGSDIVGTDDILVTQTSGAGSIVAGNGLTLTGNTIDVVAADLSLTIGADDMQVRIGSTNGTSLEVSATGLELATTITGVRTFEDVLTFGSGATAFDLPNTDGAANQILKTDGSGAVTWQDDSVSKIVRQDPENTDLAGDLASGGVVHTLSNLGTHATVKVTNVELFYNGQKQRITSDYTVNDLTGVITILFDAFTGDSFDFEYNIQNA